jgi:putative transposase
MKRSRYTEEQIIGILKQHQAGLGAKELCRKHGISDATFYKWRSKYGGMDVSDNGTELTSRVILAWQEERGVEWHYIAPGYRPPAPMAYSPMPTPLDPQPTMQ